MEITGPLRLTSLLAAARGAEASDLHLAAGSVPYMRVEGELVRLDNAPLERLLEAVPVIEHVRRRPGNTCSLATP